MKHKTPDLEARQVYCLSEVRAGSAPSVPVREPVLPQTTDAPRIHDTARQRRGATDISATKRTVPARTAGRSSRSRPPDGTATRTPWSAGAILDAAEQAWDGTYDSRGLRRHLSQEAGERGTMETRARAAMRGRGAVWCWCW